MVFHVPRERYPLVRALAAECLSDASYEAVYQAVDGAVLAALDAAALLADAPGPAHQAVAEAHRALLGHLFVRACSSLHASGLVCGKVKNHQTSGHVAHAPVPGAEFIEVQWGHSQDDLRSTRTGDVVLARRERCEQLRTRTGTHGFWYQGGFGRTE